MPLSKSVAVGVAGSNAVGLRLFTAVSSIWGIVFGLIGPFYAVYISRISGGLEKLGFAFSLMVLVQSAASYSIGRYSDKLGRKPFLFMTALADSSVLFAFTVITETYQIYILQAVLGITNAVGLTIKESMLADLTKREKRGTEIGKFNSVVSIFAAIGMAVGGLLAEFYGLKYVFYLGSAVILCSTSLLFFIREPAEEGK